MMIFSPSDCVAGTFGDDYFSLDCFAGSCGDNCFSPSQTVLLVVLVMKCFSPSQTVLLVVVVITVSLLQTV